MTWSQAQVSYQTHQKALRTNKHWAKWQDANDKEGSRLCINNEHAGKKILKIPLTIALNIKLENKSRQGFLERRLLH